MFEQFVGVIRCIQAIGCSAFKPDQTFAVTNIFKLFVEGNFTNQRLITNADFGKFSNFILYLYAIDELNKVKTERIFT